LCRVALLICRIIADFDLVNKSQRWKIGVRDFFWFLLLL
jgi:hypothetical protein